MYKKLVIIATVAVFINLTGCAAYRTTVKYPAPRPLGVKIPTVLHGANKEKSVETASEKSVRELSLQQALVQAMLKNPKLISYSFEIRAREARALQASFFPNPEIGMDVENVGGNGPVTGFNGAETTLQLSQSIELAGKRKKRTRLAALKSDLAAWDFEAKRLDVFTEVRKIFIEVLTLQQRVALQRELVKVAEQFLQSINRRVEAGKVSPAEASRAKVELSDARIKLESVKRELKTARKQLAATWGDFHPRFERVSGELESVYNLPPLRKLQELISKNPAIARWTVEMQQREAALELEKAYRIPDPVISGGFRRLNDLDRNAFVVGLSIPLPVVDRNQGAIKEAEYRKLQAIQDKKFVEIALKTLLASKYNQLLAVYREVNCLKTEIIPDAQNAYDVINDGYLMGRFGFLDLLDTQRTLFQVRSRYLNALRDYHQYEAELEGMIGQSLNGMM